MSDMPVKHTYKSLLNMTKYDDPEHRFEKMLIDRSKKASKNVPQEIATKEAIKKNNKSNVLLEQGNKNNSCFTANVPCTTDLEIKPVLEPLTAIEKIYRSIVM